MELLGIFITFALIGFFGALFIYAIVDYLGRN